MDIDPLITLVALFAIGVAGFVVLGPQRLAVTSVIVGAWTVQVSFEVFAGSSHHVGIAGGAPAITTYFLGITAVLTVLPRAGPRRGASIAFAVALAGYLTAGFATRWHLDPTAVAGAILIAFAALSVLAGERCAGWLASSPSNRRWFARLLMAWALLELGISLAQFSGVPLSIYPEVSEFTNEGRAIGTFNHPGVLGKLAVLTAPIILALTATRDPITARCAWTTLWACVAAAGLTGSRANLVALLVAALLWLLWTRGARLGIGPRIAIGAIVTGISIPGIQLALQRSSSDPFGGQREHLLDVGLRQIASDPFGGLGPNQFVQTVGLRDSIVADGFPVHNAFLLATAELGVVGAILLFLPFANVAYRSLQALARTNGRRAWSGAYLVCLPGTLLIAITGWGLLAGGTLMAWFFTLGMVGAMLDAHEPGVVLGQNSGQDRLSPEKGRSRRNDSR